MTAHGLVLLGGPGSGKDTITAALGVADSRVRLVGKLKAGTGRTASYQMVTRAELDELSLAGRLTGWFEQYGNVYAIDVEQVLASAANGLLPVTHAGYVEELAAIRQHPGVRWDVVLLDCDRAVALQRCTDRGSTDLAERAWTHDQLRDGLQRAPVPVLLHLHTDALIPHDAAAAILRAWESMPR